MKVNYESLQEKMQIMILVKMLFDNNNNVDLGTIPIEEGVDVEYYLDILTKQILGDRDEDYFYFEGMEDEETGEFVDYTGMMVYNFPHPTIHNFFLKLENIKDTKRWEDTTSLFDDKLLQIIRKSFHSDIFNDFLVDEEGIYKGVKFTFSCLNNPVYLLNGLLELVQLLDGLIIEMEKDGL